MTSTPAFSIQQSIAANKFYPPRINKTQSILRPDILADKLGANIFSSQVVIIEAQAGQGKTTLVQQFLEHCRAPFVWYQITSEDQDPVFLLGALYLAFCRKVENFSSPQVDAILVNGQIGPMDLQGCVNILLNDIDTALEEDIYLVLDDLHLINDAALTNQFLDYLIDTAPPNLHFILISRHPLQLEARGVRKNLHLVYLDNDDLALALDDIEELYNDIFSTHVSSEEAEQIFEITNGWIMGVVLVANPMAVGRKSIKPENVITPTTHLLGKGLDSFILTFFQDEILSQIPISLHEAFMKLSYLDEIDIRLAQTLIDIDHIDEHLGKMADQNFFVYPLDDSGTMFRFHHLYQEFLQSKGRQILAPEIPADIYRKAAEYYLECDLVEKALKALRNGEDYPKMEQVLKQEGLKLVSVNRTVTILAILQTIPEETLLSYGWLTFFHAFLTTDFQPQTTLPYFQTSIERFINNNDEAGELMALSQVIYFHFAISGRYNAGSQLLARARILFESIHKSLPKEISIIVCRNLAAGFCFFDGKTDLARYYARRGCELAERVGSKNFIAASRFILGYVSLLAGDQKRARMEIEKSYPLVSDPLVGMSNRLNLHLIQLCKLSMHGNFAAFSYHKDLVLEGVDREVVRQTDAAPYLYVWSAIGLISMGRHDDALDIIEQGMFISKTASSEHMTGQLLQWRSFINALRGNKEAALKDIEQSTGMRTNAGGPFFLGYHYAVKGAVLSMLGGYDEAKESLDRALQFAEQIPSAYIKICALAYLCYTSIDEQNESSIEPLLREWLELMIETGYEYFWGWESGCMLKLLTEAVRRKIEPEFANHLARQKLGHSISPEGDAVPMILIRTLGTFSISIEGTELFNIQDFSNHQREFLGLLIASPDLRISQDKVQLALWQDNPPDKASKTFYTLISRLRKVLAKKLPDPNCYINVEKNFVQLINTRVDSVRFLELAKSGLNLVRRELWWQAGNAFYEALSCWTKFSETEYFYAEDALQYTDEVMTTLRKVSLTWAKTLNRFNRIDEAIALLEKTGRIIVSEEEIVSFQYHLYMKKKNPLKARSLLDNYKRELLRMDYTKDQAEQLKREISRGQQESF